MRRSFYKKILDQIPSAVVALDKKYRVKMVNAAFLKCFTGAESSGRKTLKECVGCREEGDCGSGKGCRYCQFKETFDEVFKNGTPTLRDISFDEQWGSAVRKMTVRMNVKPLKKGYCIGLIDGVYEAEIVKELHSAQHIQQRLLPAGKEAGGVKFRYMFIPCRDIGGDLPDVYEVNGKDTFGVIADVSGKGISAGILSAFVKAGFDRNEPSPARAIAKLNDKFRELNMDEASYITVAAVRIDRENKTIDYSMAGHNAPILLKSGFDVNEIVLPAPPVSNWIDGFHYEDREVCYKEKDILVLLTDGVTESKNRQGEMFGIDRVEGILLRSSSAEQFIDKLRESLSAFCGSFEDDITAIAFDL